MDDWRKTGLKTAKMPAVMRKKLQTGAQNIKNAPRSWGERVKIPQSAALTAPNRCPSPLSLCDISPHCGESPFTREPNRLQNLSPPCKGGKRRSRRGDCTGGEPNCNAGRCGHRPLHCPYMQMDKKCGRMLSAPTVCGIPKRFIVGAAICRPRCFVMKNIRYLAYPTRALCSRAASAGESVDCLSVLYRVSSNRLSPAGRA